MSQRSLPAGLVLLLGMCALPTIGSDGHYMDHPYPKPPCPCVSEMPTPVVAIHLKAPAFGGTGTEIEYRIRVENGSPAPAHHVAVRNAIPGNARFVRADPPPTTNDPELVWQLGTLPPGGSREIWLVLASTGPGDVKNCARVQYEHGQCVCTKVDQPGAAGLQLRKEGPNQAALNDVLNYRLTVTNAGDAEAVGVVVTDAIPAGLEHESRRTTLTWDMGNIAPGQSRSVDYQVVAKQAGRLCNGAVATAAGGLRREVEHCVTVGEAKLALAMTGPARRYLNMPAEYRITVTNTGALPLANVLITNPVPTGMSYVAGRLGQLVGSEVRWSIASLNPGESQSVEVTLRAQQPGLIRNRAVASAGNVKADAEAATEFFGASALLLELVDTDDPVEVGGSTRYVILLRNQGSASVADVQIKAHIPVEIEVTQADGPSKHKTEGQILSFESMTLQPQAEARFVIHAKAIKAGDIRFKVDLTAKEPVQRPDSGGRKHYGVYGHSELILSRSGPLPIFPSRHRRRSPGPRIGESR